MIVNHDLIDDNLIFNFTTFATFRLRNKDLPAVQDGTARRREAKHLIWVLCDLILQPGFSENKCDSFQVINDVTYELVDNLEGMHLLVSGGLCTVVGQTTMRINCAVCHVIGETLDLLYYIRWTYFNF